MESSIVSATGTNTQVQCFPTGESDGRQPFGVKAKPTKVFFVSGHCSRKLKLGSGELHARTLVVDGGSVRPNENTEAKILSGPKAKEL